MISYLIQRLILIFPVLFIISFIIFAVIQLPPGDYLTNYIANLESMGILVTEAEAASLRLEYGLDKGLMERYSLWMSNILLEGDFGRSFAFHKPVLKVINERIILTMGISIITLLLVYIVAIPIGIYSATHQYSFFDYFWTFVGFIGLSVPTFLLALIVMWWTYSVFDISISGLFSQEYVAKPWSIEKFIDMSKRVWFPIIIIGMAGTAGLIRVMRGNLLDELKKQYVVTARAKGVPENIVLYRYPVRIAVNPIISTVGWLLPAIVGGEVLVSIVLNLPTIGPVLLESVMKQDMYLAGSITLILSTLTVLGTLIADILLVVLDPRIRYESINS